MICRITRGRPGFLSTRMIRYIRHLMVLYNLQQSFVCFLYLSLMVLIVEEILYWSFRRKFWDCLLKTWVQNFCVPNIPNFTCFLSISFAFVTFESKQEAIQTQKLVRKCCIIMTAFSSLPVVLSMARNMDTLEKVFCSVSLNTPRKLKEDLRSSFPVETQEIFSVFESLEDIQTWFLSPGLITLLKLALKCWESCQIMFPVFSVSCPSLFIQTWFERLIREIL